MLNLNTPVTLSPLQKKIINSFGTLTADHWKRNETRLRKQISIDLKDLQKDVCVYCGCKINGTGDVEHIADKSTYPEFLFTPKNLAYSCRTCNTTYKGSENVVDRKDPDYEKCVFNMVHPYLDDVDHFFDTTKPLISKKSGLSPAERTRADRTFSLLKWGSSEVTERRAERIMAQHYAYEHGTTIPDTAIENVLTFIP